MSVLSVVRARYAPALRWAGRPEAAGRLPLVAPTRQSRICRCPAPRRPRAHWHVVTGADGRTHLEAEWH
ncbi:hypothetical protein ACFY2W_11705 [Streptomyces sp. NPDC001262]|uniref:hypothetical protein n=1 Tax=Streptomyces TaxID=1883 RepID=UPI0036C5AF85